MDAAVVEPVDVGEGGPFDVVDVLPGPAPMDQLGLVEPVEALGEGVIVGIPFGSDAVDDAGLVQPFGVANCEVLNSAVAVMNEPVEISIASGLDGHLEGVNGQIAAQ